MFGWVEGMLVLMVGVMFDFGVSINMGWVVEEAGGFEIDGGSVESTGGETGEWGRDDEFVVILVRWGVEVKLTVASEVEVGLGNEVGIGVEFEVGLSPSPPFSPSPISKSSPLFSPSELKNEFPGGVERRIF